MLAPAMHRMNLMNANKLPTLVIEDMLHEWGFASTDLDAVELNGAK